MSPVAWRLRRRNRPREKDGRTPLFRSTVASSPVEAKGEGAVQQEYTIGPRIFVLDKAKAEAALAAKRVVGGRETMTFNLLPLRYVWAYELYRTMKANHWEPEDVPMQRDVQQWRNDSALSDLDRWIVRMGVGYFSAAEGIVGDNILNVVRELVTASELKLVLGRHAHEENIHADSLLYMISSLGIDPHECEAMFDDIPTIVAKNEFVTRVSHELRRELDMDDPADKQLLAKNVFVFGQCMEGTQFYGLFGMIL
jgi:ribonucleoside-diphosphate reductase beta chain